MSKLVISLMLAAMGCTPLCAANPTPFIGGTFHLNAATEEFAHRDFTNLDGGAKVGIGEEVDAGLGFRACDVYGGFRWAHFNMRGTTDVASQKVNAQGMWRLFRWTLGARHRLDDTKTFSPTLGGGLTWERSDVEVWTLPPTPRKMNTIKMTSPSLGWFAEGGAVYSAGRLLDLLGGVQYHQYDAPVHTPTHGIFRGNIEISYLTLYAGLMIKLT